MLRSAKATIGVGLAALSLVLASAAGAGAAPSPTGTAPVARASAKADGLAAGSYVVLMKQPASTLYTGGIAGLPATRGTKAKPFNPNSGAVKRYEAFLRMEKQRVLAEVGSPAVVYSYETATNGFAGTLTAVQASKLAGDSRVLAVVPNDRRTLDTVQSPGFLGLTGDDGVWQDQLGGVENAGKGVVVGILDSGVWPESLSFAGKRVGRNGRPIVVQKADGGTFSGACEAGENFPSNTCNDKLVSARFYVAGFKDANRKSGLAYDEYLSPRDGDGHGSHTASTAVGNNGVPVTIEGQDFGTASGMAPAAKLAVYKVCWEAKDEDATGCYGADSVAAIDQAVNDGVNVINFSISGSTTTTVDAVEYAFFGAAAAGVFVAASAGNSGPDASTVAHPSPWLMTVAASTQKPYEGTVVLGNGEEYVGAMVSNTGVDDMSPLVYAGDVAVSGAAEADAKICVPGTLDASAVTGTIVVCDRGVINRVDKSAAVKAAGGIGMVLANPTENSLDPDFHSVPTVHVGVEAGNAIRTYSQAEGAMAKILPENQTLNPTPFPQIAGFSSRGPSLANQGDLLKPDISAPGVGIVAAVSPPHNSGRSFDLYSGTSMSSPHIAGLGALILGAHPDWTPATVKSAMMTTAYDLKGTVDAMAQGAGHVDPTRFLHPGLAYDATIYDWAQFYKGQGLDLFDSSETDDFPAIAPADLNTPSIQIGQLAGTKTVTRTVTALEEGTWTATVDAPPGVDVTVDPASLTLGASDEGQFTVKMDVNASADLTEFTNGFVTWSNASTDVRIPIAVRPVSVAAPTDVAGTVDTEGKGSVDITVTGGFDGTVDIDHAGLAEGAVDTGTLVPGQEAEYVVDVPADASFARFDLDATNDMADLDLVVYQLPPGGGDPVDVFVSATGSADERVDLFGPAEGRYVAYAIGYANAAGESSTEYTQSNFVVGPAGTGEGGMTVEPNPLTVVRGTEATFTVSWSDLEDTSRYLGWVGYAGALQPTIITVN
jgi:hypothetical protein